MNDRENSFLAQNNLLFFLLVLINTVAFTIGMLVYGEPFYFWQNPISDLGQVYTVNGYPNTLSFILFGLDMLASGFIMIAIGLNFKKAGIIPKQRKKKNLSYVASIGFYITLFPHDINNTIHSIGAAMMFGSLWGMSIIFLLEAKSQISSCLFYSLHILLQGTVLTYAVTFMFDSPIKQTTQKFGIFGLMLVLKISSGLVLKPLRVRNLRYAEEK